MKTISRMQLVETLYEAIVDATIVHNYEPLAGGTCVAIEFRNAPDSYRYMTALGAVFERSSTVVDYVYQFASRATVNRDDGITLFFPGWELSD